jgi:hypothetical protein
MQARAKFLGLKAVSECIIKNIIASFSNISGDHNSYNRLSDSIVYWISVKNVSGIVLPHIYESYLSFELKKLSKYFQNRLLSSISVQNCLEQFAQANKQFSQANKRFSQADKQFTQANKQFAQANKTICITNPNKALISYMVEIIFVCFKETEQI